eukprot:TRINITY_DN6765_c0_g1_i3.p3 TRINITY_DN6765_c0_g1~~TRINITY_DN6765_c0_g1_i3.p3  ORF type:complete len:126 (-),score=13.86 TRINITY_DN6765_c0_g1_i3:930-1307(-)
MGIVYVLVRRNVFVIVAKLKEFFIVTNYMQKNLNVDEFAIYNFHVINICVKDFATLVSVVSVLVLQVLLHVRHIEQLSMERNLMNVKHALILYLVVIKHVIDFFPVNYIDVLKFVMIKHVRHVKK